MIKRTTILLFGYFSLKQLENKINGLENHKISNYYNF